MEEQIVTGPSRIPGSTPSRIIYSSGRNLEDMLRVSPGLRFRCCLVPGLRLPVLVRQGEVSAYVVIFGGAEK